MYFSRFYFFPSLLFTVNCFFYLIFLFFTSVLGVLSFAGILTMFLMVYFLFCHCSLYSDYYQEYFYKLLHILFEFVVVLLLILLDSVRISRVMVFRFSLGGLYSFVEFGFSKDCQHFKGVTLPSYCVILHKGAEAVSGRPLTETGLQLQRQGSQLELGKLFQTLTIQVKAELKMDCSRYRHRLTLAVRDLTETVRTQLAQTESGTDEPRSHHRCNQTTAGISLIEVMPMQVVDSKTGMAGSYSEESSVGQKVAVVKPCPLCVKPGWIGFLKQLLSLVVLNTWTLPFPPFLLLLVHQSQKLISLLIFPCVLQFLFWCLQGQTGI